MSKEKDIQIALRKLVGVSPSTDIAKVVSVDAEQGVCEIEMEGLNYTDVRLSAVIDGHKNKCYLVPKTESWVLVGRIENDIHRLYVKTYSEVEKVTYTIDKTIFEIDEKGYNISKDGKTLKDILDGLIAVMTKIVVVQGKGPDIGKLKELDGQIKDLLI